MNDTATAGGATGASLIPGTTDVFTIAHLAIVALFAIAVIAAIVWGARLKSRRKAAERDIAEHNVAVVEAAAPVAPPVPVREDAQAAAPVAVSPSVETIPAHAPPESVPAPVPASAAAPADASVSTLKGLGPKLATRLGELGITTVGQVAALTDDAAERLDAQLGPFAGRMARDRWIEQARFLAAGDRAGFEAVFGRL